MLWSKDGGGTADIKNDVEVEEECIKNRAGLYFWREMDGKVGHEGTRERLVKDEISEKEWVNRKVMTWWHL